MTATPWLGWQNEYDKHDRALDRVLAALDAQGLKHVQHSGYVMASCPLHKDVDPSMSIREKQDPKGQRKVTLICRSADCPTFDIAEALGLRDDQLWDEQARPCPRCGRRSLEPGVAGDYSHAGDDGCGTQPRSRRPRPASAAPAPNTRPGRLGPLPKRVTEDVPEPRYTVVVPRRVTDRYDHSTLDEGEVVATSVRQEEIRHYDGEDVPRTVKKFWQEYTDGAGGWVQVKPEDLVVPLWRVDEVNAARAEMVRIWLAEGHKDARSLLAAGAEVATTNIAGALSFNAGDAEQLRGGDVVVVCDRDHAGYARGLKILRLLDGVAASVQVVLPMVQSDKADATDHVQAGFGLDQFVPVTAAELEAWEKTTAITAQIGIPDLTMAAAEAAAQTELAAAAAATAPRRSEEHRRKAARWAVQLGRALTTMTRRHQELAALPGHTTAQLAAATAHVTALAEQVKAVYATCGVEPPEDVAVLLQPESSDDQSTVIDPQPPQWSRIPQHPFPMMRGEWRYDTGSNCDRGIYLWAPGNDTRPGQWRWMAPLPWLQARLVRRDGTGNRCGTDYLMSADPDGKAIIVGYLGLRDGTWANELGLTLSQDDKIIKAAASAILDAAEAAPERETTPRIDYHSGKISVPAPESLPAGYLRCAPGGRDQGLAVWAEIIRVVVEAPKMALVAGASAISPFLSTLKHHHQSHFVAIYGDPRQGKTTALRLAGAVWGNPGHGEEGGVVTGWNASGIGTARYAGMLGTLPPIFDESGMKKNTPAEWAEVISSMCEGAQRLTAETRGPGIRLSKPWRGVLISSGNGRLTAGLGAGADAGIAARVVDLATPITSSADQAELLEDELLGLAYGHAGLAIMDQVTLPEAEALVADAVEILGLPAAGSGRTIAKALHTHVAGAALLDRVAGTGTMLRDAAIIAAVEHLTEWAEPEHDADRILSAIADARAREPAMWPTVSEYLQHLEPDQYPGDPNSPPGMTRLPHHGVSRTLTGLRADNGSWLAVFKEPWKELGDKTGIDQAVALRELHKRGLLVVSPNQRRRGEWATRIRAAGVDMYKLLLPNEPDDSEQDDPTAADGDTAQTPGDVASAGTEGSAVLADSTGQPALPTPTPAENLDEDAVRGDTDARTGSVRGDVRGDNEALTRGVRGVRGDREEHIHVPARGNSHALDAPADGAGIPLDPGRPSGTWQAVDGSQHHRGWARQSGPCQDCGRPCSMVIDGHRIHPPCLERRLAKTPEQVAAETPATQPGPASAGSEPTPAETPTPEPLTGRPGGQDRPNPRAATRWTADSVVLDTDDAFLGTGTRVPPPAAAPRHAGDLVAWGHRLGLGHGGGRHKPDPGRIWLTPAAADELGLPSKAPRNNQAMAKQLTAMRQTAFFTDAEAAGWQIRGGQDSPWLKVFRDDAQMIITCTAWGAGRYDEILAADPSPAEFARRLGLLAETVGHPYTVSPAVTGLEALERRRPDGLPPVKIPDVEYNHIGANPSWMLPLAALEQHRDSYAHLYDRTGSYLGAAGVAVVGSGDYLHHPSGCDPTPKTGGLWRIAPLEADPLPMLPGFDPLDPLGFGDATGWVSSSMLQLLMSEQVPLTVLEAYTWTNSGKLMADWYTHLRTARSTLRGLQVNGDPQATALLRGDPEHHVNAAFKLTYTGTIGRLAWTGDREPLEPFYRYRPHWRAEVVGTHTANTLRAALRIHRASDPGPVPVAIGKTDGVVYLSPHSDPVAGWPGAGNDALNGETLGKFTPVAGASALVGNWLDAIHAALADNPAAKPDSLIDLLTTAEL